MVSDILKYKGISLTQFRERVLEILISSQKPLTQKEIESLIDSKHDRVTLYRTLKLFVQKNIIHKIPVSETLSAYRYIEPEINSATEHLHFHCTDCERVYCMPNIPVQHYKLPHGFNQKSANLVVNGICHQCNNK